MYYLKTSDREFAINFLDKYFPKTKKKTFLFGGVEITIIENSKLPKNIIEFWSEAPPKCIARYEVEI